jgi:hypothetical protein
VERWPCEDERRRRASLPDHLQSRDRRSDERFFHAAAEGSQGGSAAPFRTGIRDFSGYPGVIAAAATSQRVALRVSRTAARREQTLYAICALGAVANVAIAGYIFSRNEIWWLAGVAGGGVGSVWNYAVSSVFTWKQK